MDINTAKDLSKKLKISLDWVVREEYEMLLLKEIFESEFSSNLIFKGGTALRLAYGSPRFSEDLDFDAIGNFDSKKFLSFLKKIVRYPGVTDVKTREKFYTVFGLVKVKDEILARPFSTKVEISKRKGRWTKDKDYFDKLIFSEVTVFRVLARVASLEKILKEKKEALKRRKAPRDVFDYWFISQALGKRVKTDFSGHDRALVKSELRRLLPRSYWRLIDSWLE